MTRNIINTGPSIGAPRWAGDYLSRDHLVPAGAKVDAAQFPALGATNVVLTAGAAAAAVALAVTALASAIKAGTVLYFGGQKFARVTADAAAAAVALVVDPLPVALVTGDTAAVDGRGKKTIPSGTVVGRTFAEAAAKTPYGVPADADTDVVIVAFDVEDASDIDDVEIYRPGSVVKENYLANRGALTAAVLATVRARYVCILGEA